VKSLLISLLLCGTAFAATHYVCAGASGSGTGANYTNACTDFTGSCAVSSLVRGDTYIVANGAYSTSTRTFNTADSGTTPITIEAATDTNSVGVTGYTTGGSGTCHQGQATFGAILIQSDYWTWTGSYRQSSTGHPWLDWRAGYGFKVNNNNGSNVPRNASAAFAVGIPGSNQPEQGITIEYTEIAGSGDITGTYQDNGIYASGGNSTGDVFDFNYVHDVGLGAAIDCDSCNSLDIAYNWEQNNEVTATNHSELTSIRCWNSGTDTSITIRYNYEENSNSTAMIATPCGPTSGISPANWAIYGNVFLYNVSEQNPSYSCAKTPTECGNGDGWLSLWNFGPTMASGVWTGYLYVFNNTISYIDQPPTSPPARCGHDWGTIASSTTMGVVAFYNNVYYGCTANTVVPPGCPGTCSSYVEDYTSYFNTAHSDSNPHVQISSSDPFTNVSDSVANADDFSLNGGSDPTTAGFNTNSLVAGNGADLVGTTRNTSAWSRGALQFTGGGGSASAPAFTLPVPGTYVGTQTPTVTSSSGGTIILCYTTNGATPVTNGLGTGCTTGTSLANGGTVTASATTTFKAVAGTSTLSDSSVTTAVYMIRVATPTFSPIAGAYTSAQSVTISTSTGSATICYTTNGSTPTANGAGTCTSGTTYSTAVNVALNETLKAIGSKSGDTDSAVGSAAYVLQGSAPTFSPAAGAYYIAQTVTITQAQSLAMCYTTNGATPLSNGSGSCSTGTLYSGPITVSATETVKAIGMASGWTDSSAGIAAYTIDAAQNLPTLPQVWVNNNEGNSAFSFELSLPSTWITGPPGGCTFSTPYWSGSPTLTGLQSAVVDIEACRTSSGVGIVLDIPPANYTGAAGLYLPQSNTAAASSFLILRSTQDTHLPNGQTVCSHGIQDNLSTSTDIGLDNPDCAGDVMYYQLGTTQTTVSVGPITLANGTVTNTSAYDDVQYMWTAEGSGTTPTALRFCAPVGGGSTSSLTPACTSTTLAPDHWLIEDGEFRMQAGDISPQDIVSMPGSGSETATSQYPTHIHFRKDWVHGDWTTLLAGANSVSDAFNLICQNCSIVDSQTSQNLRPSAEGHSVLMQGTQFKVDHNWFEGQSIGMFTGGTCSPWPVAGYVPFQDVEERRNRFTFPFTWLGTTIPGGNADWPGYSIERKNTNELKSGQRVLRTGNIMENSDASGGQGGTLGDVKTSNDSCGFGTNYQNIVSDVTDVSNIWRNSCEGIETIRNPGAVGGVDFGTRRWEIANTLFYNTSETNFGCSENEGIQIDAVGWAWQGTLTENSNGTATFVANCSVNSGGCIGQVASATVSGCSAAGTLTFSAPSITGGTKAAGSFNASCVATISNPGAGYTSAPTVTATSGTATATINASSTTPGTGFTVLDMLPEDPAAVTQCNSVTSFNQPTTSYSSGYLPSGIGPPVAAGVNPASLTTTYAWPTSTTPFGSVDSSGYCKLTNMQSFPQAFVWDHNTAIMDSTNGLSQGNGFGNSVVNGPNFEQNTLLRDSIFLGGGWRNSSGIASGTATEKFNYDITSMSVDHLVWPTQTASTYTEYGNNASYPDSAGCTGAGCSPPTTMYFPTTPYCTGSTSTSACIGFLGAMSASSMPLTLTDYHQYALRSDSSFYAGAADDASDGTSMGVNISTIDSAQTQNLFACTSSCGSSGPFPDVVTPTNTIAPAPWLARIQAPKDFLATSLRVH